MAFLVERGRGLPTQVVTPELFKEIVESKQLYEDVAYIRQSLKNMAFHEQAGNKEEAKKWKTEAGRRKAMLPGWVFQARCMVDHEWIDSKKVNHGIAAWRHQDWAMVNGLVMCDFDHIDNPRQTWEAVKDKVLAAYNVLMAFITPSGRGLKVAFVADGDMDIAGNQKAFAKVAGLEEDDVCFDASRLSFATTREDLLYFDKKIFTTENEKFKEKYTEKYFKGVTHPDMFGGARRAGAAPAAGDSAGKHGGKAADVAGTAAVQEYELDRVKGELPLEPVVHETYEFVNEIMTLAEVEGNKAEAFLVKRVPYYGINITAPFILMRHYKEWQEKRTFKCDKKDVAFCRLILELQMHAQRFFFGSYAQKYFDDSMRDMQSRQYSARYSKSDDVYSMLPGSFRIEEVLEKSDLKVSAARMMISRWVKKGMVKKLEGKRGCEVWKKEK